MNIKYLLLGIAGIVAAYLIYLWYQDYLNNNTYISVFDDVFYNPKIDVISGTKYFHYIGAEAECLPGELGTKKLSEWNKLADNISDDYPEFTGKYIYFLFGKDNPFYLCVSINKTFYKLREVYI